VRVTDVPATPPAGSGRSRDILDAGFGDDDGAVSPDVAQALVEHEQDPSTYLEAVAVLQDARLLVPVVAVLGESEQDAQGRTRDKSSDMATVLMTSSAGRTALLAFTGTAPMQRWRTDSRPVPVSVPHAAQAALQDGAEALLVDVAGPARFVVRHADLRALADGFRLVRISGRLAWAKAVAGDEEPGERGR
jgi:hypothetical protein